MGRIVRCFTICISIYFLVVVHLGMVLDTSYLTSVGHGSHASGHAMHGISELGAMRIKRNATALNTNVESISHRSLEAETSKPLVIYSHLRKDQSGWVIMDMLKAHSFAFERNVTYGGACGDSQHIEDIRNVLDLAGLDNVLPLKCPPTNTGDNELENDGLRHVLYHASLYEKGYQKRMGSHMWKKHIQQQLYFKDDNEVQTNNGKNTTKIVVHIRRRDVTPCCYPSWYVPNAYFLAMIDKCKKAIDQLQPKSDVQVDIFSQEDSFESWTPFQRYNLHLGGEVGQVWKAILNAHYFIGSKSEFSRVPAMFTRARVIEEFQDWPPFEQESQRVFGNCTDSMIFSCKHKWWQNGSSKAKKKTVLAS
jgi:hypothetical protein